MSDEDTLLKFPCDFPIKAMGKSDEDFDSLVVGLVRKHSPDLTEGAVKTSFSKGGKYMSVTVTIQAQSKRQLDAIYLELSGHERILMAL